MADVKHRTQSQVVDGLRIPAVFSAENFRSAVRYKPRSDDVFIITYPKCGTTWAQHILALIFQINMPCGSKAQVLSSSLTYLEAGGSSAAAEMPWPGAIKMHVPFHLTPFSSEAKYIYIARNPKDCCVSYFHHMRASTGHPFEGTFDEFFELFLIGEVDYGDYFDHLLGWYEHRNDPNVLFMTYEQMKENPKETILKFAAFLGEKYESLLRSDPKVLEDIVHRSSFDFMRERVNRKFDRILQMNEDQIKSSTDIPADAKPLFLKLISSQNLQEGKRPSGHFMRKGIVGDWKNYFSPEQSIRMDEKFAMKARYTELLDLWKKYM